MRIRDPIWRAYFCSSEGDTSEKRGFRVLYEAGVKFSLDESVNRLYSQFATLSVTRRPVSQQDLLARLAFVGIFIVENVLHAVHFEFEAPKPESKVNMGRVLKDTSV